MAKELKSRRVSSPKTGLHRGTTGYAINFFRSDILVNLQLDLKRLEKSGIDEDVCSKIRELLSALVSAASAEPKGSFWGRAVHKVLRDYELTYREWNNVKGTDTEAARKRDELLSSLQDIRHAIANVCRRNAHSLSEAHDLELITAINEALKEAIKAVPGTFSALTRSAERFAARALT
ncbi:hypothetical protein PMN64_11265 [Bradyrhizobium sp. UFLA01-814]|uniref:hypothetical protein n=1 Tax=Bradyrhizobium sp. UFLA01-814 TaxID=3023480 RepID=UPI00398B10C6